MQVDDCGGQRRQCQVENYTDPTTYKMLLHTNTNRPRESDQHNSDLTHIITFVLDLYTTHAATLSIERERDRESERKGDKARTTGERIYCVWLLYILNTNTVSSVLNLTGNALLRP